MSWLVNGLLGLLLVIATSAFAAAPAKPDMERGARLFDQGDPSRGIVACASCHGAGGNSEIPVYPNLAAQPHEYLARQLHDFQIRPGATQPRRMAADSEVSVMTPMVEALTPADIQDIALYLAQQALSAPASAALPELFEPGQRLWRAGAADRGVPACAACHGPNGAGLPAQYPRLAGQFSDYLKEQLTLLRSGARSNSPVMQDIAGRLTDDDIKAVADYGAGLR
ncbi:c-type cytochrome [Bordetella avium]|uniref:Cytochrome C n=1 Tax=Bordetella avium (strain 197N) TaxID=360910 RepID=Q2L214_BORA1|nr:c-type cytochrome [Bordetella avium]AZY47747.1 cytochrome C [Bordetella avium]RIQ18482.1 cytochrome C [Bordetella avium]RIQ35482.1 cytochrome C [Bordetella avium]RIQ53881.1 cytochrome C [Bordetella avium]RIQ74261.1 cytochrome C [Bordetella avium]